LDTIPFGFLIVDVQIIRVVPIFAKPYYIFTLLLTSQEAFTASIPYGIQLANNILD